MDGVNDIAFRVLCRRAGAGLTYTGMINPLSRQKLGLDDEPAIQLFCNNEKGVKEFIKKHDKQVSLWDFNLGCPAELAKKCRVGAYLTDLRIIEKILKIMREPTKKPVTIKIRKSTYAEKLLKIAEKYCDALAIHPRTREQGYSGEPDLEFARKMKKETCLPVIYSGDVDENNAKELLKEFDFVMVGRKAMGNPNVFAKLTGNKARVNFLNYLALAEKYKLTFSQIKRQAVWFTKEKEYAKSLREKLTRAKTIKELDGLLK